MSAILLPEGVELFSPAEEVSAGPDRPLVFFYPKFKTWRLAEDFAWQHGEHLLIVTSPFDFDLASIPRIVWPLLASHELGILAPLFHDWLYRSGGTGFPGSITPARTYTRAQADALFKMHMELDGVSWWRRNVAYRAVRWFGGSSWQARRQ